MRRSLLSRMVRAEQSVRRSERMVNESPLSREARIRLAIRQAQQTGRTTRSDSSLVDQWDNSWGNQRDNQSCPTPPEAA